MADLLTLPPEEAIREVERIAELEKKATPGEWMHTPAGRGIRVIKSGLIRLARMDQSRTSECNAALLVASRNALPALLALSLEALRARAEKERKP